MPTNSSSSKDGYFAGKFPSSPPPPGATSGPTTSPFMGSTTSTTSGTPLNVDAKPYVQTPPTRVSGTPPPPSPNSMPPSAGASITTPKFHLESREEMMQRRKQNSSGNSPLIGVSPVMGFSLPPPLPTGILNAVPPPPPPAGPNLMPYDYILVLDFEATCEEPEPYNYLPEIIEFPVVVLNVAERRVVAEFHSYVRPVANTVLSPFCVKLTGIRQKDVDSAPTIEHVLDRFQRWYQRTIPRGARVVFATDGPWDMRDFMYTHTVCRRGISFPPIFYTWIDVKAAFADFFSCRWSKIEAMLQMLGMTFEGRLHSGIDDARNICRIVVALLNKGCVMTTNIQRIPIPPDPIALEAEKAQGSPPPAGAGSSSTTEESSEQQQPTVSPSSQKATVQASTSATTTPTTGSSGAPPHLDEELFPPLMACTSSSASGARGGSSSSRDDASSSPNNSTVRDATSNSETGSSRSDSASSSSCGHNNGGSDPTAGSVVAVPPSGSSGGGGGGKKKKRRDSNANNSSVSSKGDVVAGNSSITSTASSSGGGASTPTLGPKSTPSSGQKLKKGLIEKKKS